MMRVEIEARIKRLLEMKLQFMDASMNALESSRISEQEFYQKSLDKANALLNELDLMLADEAE